MNCCMHISKRLSSLGHCFSRQPTSSGIPSQQDCSCLASRGQRLKVMHQEASINARLHADDVGDLGEWFFTHFISASKRLLHFGNATLASTWYGYSEPIIRKGCRYFIWRHQWYLQVLFVLSDCNLWSHNFTQQTKKFKDHPRLVSSLWSST